MNRRSFFASLLAAPAAAIAALKAKPMPQKPFMAYARKWLNFKRDADGWYATIEVKPPLLGDVSTTPARSRGRDEVALHLRAGGRSARASDPTEYSRRARGAGKARKASAGHPLPHAVAHRELPGVEQTRDA